jgi:hypothetical protein
MVDAEERKGIRGTAFLKADANADGKITLDELAARLSTYAQPRGPSDSQPPSETLFDKQEELRTEQESINVTLKELTTRFEDVLKPQADVTFYEVVEVGKEFIRVRREKIERIIPFASIREIRRTLDD